MQQHGRKYFASRPHSPHNPRDGVKRSKFNFFRTWSCGISNRRESRMQQHVSTYFASPPALGMGSIGQNSTFNEHGHVAYRIKGNRECNNMVRIFCPQTTLPPTSTLRIGSIDQKSSFTEHGHVTYQIDWYHECSNMVANSLPADPTKPPIPDPGDGVKNSKFNFFQNMFLLHIKLKGITDTATWSRIHQHGSKYLARRPPPPTPDHLGVFNRSKLIF